MGQSRSVDSEQAIDATQDASALQKPPRREAQQQAGMTAAHRIAANSEDGKRGGVEWKRAAGQLYLHGNGVDADAVSANDPRQGAVGDCWLIAAMIAVANANPQAIRSLIEDRGNGTYVVNFWVRAGDDAKPTRLPVVVNAVVPESQSGQPVYASSGDFGHAGRDLEIWPLVLEKALMVALNDGWDEHRLSYTTLENVDLGPAREARITRGMSLAMRFLTGGAPTPYAIRTTPPVTLLQAIDRGLRDHCPVETGTYQNFDKTQAAKAAAHGLSDNHAYAVLAIDLTKWAITVRDPHGVTIELALDEYLAVFESVSIGASLAKR